jgi:hypothetical protein
MVDTVVVDAIDPIVVILLRLAASEYMNVMTPPFESGGKLRHVNTQPADID